MNYFEIGSISYFTNVPKGYYPTEEEAESVAETLVEAFDAKLGKSQFSNELAIIGAEVRLGCIIATITIGASIAAIHRFIKNYPSFRPGLLLLLQDLNGLVILVRGNKQRTYLYRDDIAPAEELKAIADKIEQKSVEPVQPQKRLTKRSRGRAESGAPLS